jgi:hypothetical protein
MSHPSSESRTVVRSTFDQSSRGPTPCRCWITAERWDQDRAAAELDRLLGE